MKNSLFLLVFILLFFAFSCGGDPIDTGGVDDTENEKGTDDVENVDDTEDEKGTADVENVDETQDLEIEEEVNDADMEEITDDHAEESGCVDSSFIEPDPDYDSYFALNVVAEINPDGSIFEMTEAIYKDFNIKIKDHPEIMLDSSMVSAFFVEDDEYVFIGAFGDNRFHEKHHETSILAMIPTKTLISMKSIDLNYIDEAPRIQMNRLEELPGKYSKVMYCRTS